jgi:hypothetical protein
MVPILSRLKRWSPISLGTVFMVGGAYVGWVFYQAAQGQVIEIDIQQPTVNLHINEYLQKKREGGIIALGADILTGGNLIPDCTDLERLGVPLPDIRTELEFENPMLVAVNIHEIDGDLTVEGAQMDYELEGLDGDEALGGGEQMSVFIELSPDLAECTVLLEGVQEDQVVDVTFEGSARVSVWGVEQEIPILIETTIDSPI